MDSRFGMRVQLLKVHELAYLWFSGPSSLSLLTVQYQVHLFSYLF